MNDIALVTMPLNAPQRVRIESAAPGWTYRYVAPGTATAEDVRGVRVILGNLPPTLLPFADRLEWLQLNNAGTEGFTDGVLPSGARLTNASGAYGVAISEHIVGMLLALMKRLYAYHDNQLRAEWRDEGHVSSIDGANALIVGAGDIGLATARLLKAFGARVSAIRRTPGTLPACVDEQLPPDALDEALARADIVLLALPGNAQTRHLFDRARLARMKKGAYLLNIGRGSAIDQDALADALDEGRLAGAALDVTDPEPLPSNARLWRTPNCAITPHISGQYHLPATLDRIVDISARNLARFVNGEPLINLVDMQTGYRTPESAR